MNFLAHIFLSGDDPDVQTGNFIGDFVRNVNLPEYPPQVQNGIELHWKIDEFTDHHKVVKESKSILYPGYKKYSAVLVDIFYDHFLALKWDTYCDQDLYDYTIEFYEMMEKRIYDLPFRVQRMLPYMKRENWLYHYRSFDGIQNVLLGMGRRASFKSNMENAVVELVEYHDEFERHFDKFFPKLQNMAQEFLLEKS